MFRVRRALLAVALVSSAAAGCPFTGDINEAPTVSRPRLLDGVLALGERVTFGAEASDPDGEGGALRLRWSFRPRACEQGSARLGSPAPVEGPTFAVDIGERGFLCVGVTAVDEHGATAFSEETFAVDDRVPVVALALAVTRGDPAPAAGGKHALFSSFKVSAAATRDPDRGDDAGLKFAWMLTRPNVPAAGQNDCVTARNDEFCFTAATSGTYSVDALVTDPHGGSASKILAVEVAPDRPPCIVQTSIPYDTTLKLSHAAPTTLRVERVTDDGDPWPFDGPPRRRAFFWSYRLGTKGDYRVVGSDDQLNTFGFGPQYFGPTEKVQVRVQYRDRVDAEGPGRDYRACEEKDGQPCALVKDCHQWIVWTIEYY